MSRIQPARFSGVASASNANLPMGYLFISMA